MDSGYYQNSTINLVVFWRVGVRVGIRRTFFGGGVEAETKGISFWIHQNPTQYGVDFDEIRTFMYAQVLNPLKEVGSILVYKIHHHNLMVAGFVGVRRICGSIRMPLSYLAATLHSSTSLWSDLLGQNFFDLKCTRLTHHLSFASLLCGWADKWCFVKSFLNSNYI